MNGPATPKIDTPFINIQSDYGFKRTFGTERFKVAVIRLLDAALGDEIRVRDVKSRLKYRTKEILPDVEGGKRIVYDVYFTFKSDPGGSLLKPYHLNKEDKSKPIEHHFILEMQNIYDPPFEDRALYYVTRVMSDQGTKGWKYDMDPVISITITDFDFPHLKKQLIQDFQLRERTTGEILTKKLRMLFYSLKQLPDKWEQCENELQRRLYLIKNMEKMDKNSKAYLEGGYEDMFDAAESSRLAAEDIVTYSNSLAHLRSVQAGLDYKYDQGMEVGRREGRREGIREGRREGRREGLIDMARNLLSLGVDIDAIIKASGLSANEIAALK